MTALQSIIKEAKAIRKKSPKMEWKKAVAQASAIYASKHKGKSPVGKKRAVKKKIAKKVAKKRAIGKTDKKLQKGLASKSLKMPHGYDVVKRKRKIGAVKKSATTMHKDTKSHNVNIRVMSGVDNDLIKQLNTYKGLIRYYTNNIEIFKEAIKKRKERGLTPIMVSNLKKDIKKFQSLIKEYKIHLTQLKKHI
jgi:hypothetical protein